MARQIALETIFANRAYWPNGKLKRKDYSYPAIGALGRGNVVSFGMASDWDEEGHLVETTHFSGNKVDGFKTTYGKDGRVLGRWEYVRGKPVDGKRGVYWENGKIKSESNYLNQQLFGRQATWAENGQVLTDWQYERDLPVDGIEEQWNQEGTLEVLISWKSGKKAGLYFERNHKDVFSLLSSTKLYRNNGPYLGYLDRGELLEEKYWWKSGPLLSHTIWETEQGGGTHIVFNSYFDQKGQLVQKYQASKNVNDRPSKLKDLEGFLARKFK